MKFLGELIEKLEGLPYVSRVDLQEDLEKGDFTIKIMGRTPLGNTFYSGFKFDGLDRFFVERAIKRVKRGHEKFFREEVNAATN